VNGLLVIDKPGGMTSRDAVNRVQKWFPRKTKIGHTGTLDPLATGVLVVCIGAATRLADYVQAMGKSYTSRFRLGAISTSDDADGEICEKTVATVPTRDTIESALAEFCGVIQQIPPAVSALKVDGHRAHALVRKGEDVALAARTVRIDAIRVTHYEWPWLDVEVDCGKGTYIRAIARDLGAALGVGGLVQALRRTRIGCYRVEEAIDLEHDPQTVAEKLRPLATALSALPAVQIASSDCTRFRQGQAVLLRDTTPHSPGVEVAVFDDATALVGIGEMQPNNRVQPKVILTR
jgi:tRNA pseudouridine55 synthase